MKVDHLAALRITPHAVDGVTQQIFLIRARLLYMFASGVESAVGPCFVPSVGPNNPRLAPSRPTGQYHGNHLEKVKEYGQLKFWWLGPSFG